MYKHDYSDIERILKKLGEENPSALDSADEIDESVFARIESNVVSRLSKDSKAKKAKTRIYFRAVAAAFSIIAVFSIAFYLIDLPETKASKDLQAINAHNEVLQELQNEAISTPEYIPAGYVQDADYAGNGDFQAEYKYINSADESLFILITADRETVQIPDGGKTVEIKEYNGLPMSFINLPGSPDVNTVVFYSVHDYWVNISSTLDYDTIMEIMVSME